MLTHSRTRSDAILPLSEPITGVDGSTIREVHVPKDTTVIVGVLSSNCNKAIWGEDAQEWKPERWLNQLPESVTNAKIPGIYSNLYAPRICPHDFGLTLRIQDDVPRRRSRMHVRLVLATARATFDSDMSLCSVDSSSRSSR